MLTAAQKAATAKELQENYRRLGYDEARVLSDLRFTPERLHAALFMTRDSNGSDTWKLRDYLLEMLDREGKRAYPFSVMADPSVNRWFTYERTWQ